MSESEAKDPGGATDLYEPTEEAVKKLADKMWTLGPDDAFASARHRLRYAAALTDYAEKAATVARLMAGEPATPPPTDALAPDLLAQLREATRTIGFSDGVIIDTGIWYLSNLKSKPTPPADTEPAPYTLPAAIGQELVELSGKVPQSIEEIVRAGMSWARSAQGMESPQVGAFDLGAVLRQAASVKPSVSLADAAPPPAVPKSPRLGQWWVNVGGDYPVEVVGLPQDGAFVKARVQNAEGVVETWQREAFKERHIFQRDATFAPPPTAPELPQAGEVWRRNSDGEVFEIEETRGSWTFFHVWHGDGSTQALRSAEFLSAFEPLPADPDEHDEATASTEFHALEHRRLLERIEVKALELAVAGATTGEWLSAITDRARIYADHLHARILGGGA